MRSALFTTKQRQSMKMADIQSPWMKSGIQALEHKYPDKPVTPGKAAHMEFEYIRHGTVSLIGFFDVATRHMEKPYLNSTREYSCAVTPQVRQTGNRLSGLAGTAYASLLT